MGNYCVNYGMYVPLRFIVKEFCMKNLLKLFGIITLMVVIGLGMTACIDDSEDDQSGHRYLVVNESMTWDEASAYARDMGGYLAIINNANEQTVVHNLIMTDGDKNFYWLGGYRDGNTWKWQDGSKFSYTNWCPGQPDNYQNREDKLMIMRIPNPRSPRATPGKWDDLSADGLITGEEYFGIDNKGLIIEWNN
jgi:hypothetical protein